MAERRPSQRLYAPPWRELRPDGKLGEWYGPKTAATFAKQVADYRNWSYREPPSKSLRDDAERVRAYMRLEDGTVRLDVPDSEVRVYRLLYEDGVSIGGAAKRLSLSRESVRTYLRRLRARVSASNRPG